MYVALFVDDRFGLSVTVDDDGASGLAPIPFPSASIPKVALDRFEVRTAFDSFSH